MQWMACAPTAPRIHTRLPLETCPLPDALLARLTHHPPQEAPNALATETTPSLEQGPTKLARTKHAQGEPTQRKKSFIVIDEGVDYNCPFTRGFVANFETPSKWVEDGNHM